MAQPSNKRAICDRAYRHLDVGAFVMLLALAGLSAVPKHLYEAAEIDRAGSWYTSYPDHLCRWSRRC